ncbi:F-box domain-containing protein [Madurella fahalii]|uniref:F-box domain-containing protein n=1 Tax=Madurella fahalii TaxID=1157608 RepID=A0ABQ0G6G0_9PEZI
MSPAVVYPRHSAGQQPGNRTLHLEDLPVETMIEIISHLDFEAFDNMLRVNRRLRSVIESYGPSILPGIIEQEFFPAEDFFYAFQSVVSPSNKLHIGHFPFEVGNIGSRPPKLGLPRQFLNCYPPLWSATNRLHSLLNFCRAIKRWEMEFPCLRFYDHPEYSRGLRPHELCRLRQGLYVWWLFARHFHDSPAQLEHSDPLDHYVGHRFSFRKPECSPELRRAFMRQLSTTQLHEVYDVWETIRSAVGREVCPSVVAVREWSGNTLTRVEAARIGWGDPVENDHILATIMKLRPDDILHLLVYRHRYATKGSIIQFVRLRHPRIEESIETFSEAIIDVIREREGMLGPDDLYFPLSGFPRRYGGIIDHETPETEELRVVYNTDAGSERYHYSSSRHDRDRYMVNTVPLGRLVASS